MNGASQCKQTLLRMYSTDKSVPETAEACLLQLQDHVPKRTWNSIIGPLFRKKTPLCSLRLSCAIHQEVLLRNLLLKLLAILFLGQCN